MAKIKWSGIGIVDGRGKINGTVLSKNRGGAYARVKVTPSNPRSAAQMFVRSNLAFLAQKWKTLTQNQRDAWAGAVSDYTRTDVFGDVKTPTGYSLFMRINTSLRDASTNLFFNIPAPTVEIAGVESVNGVAGDPGNPGSISVSFDDSSTGNGYLLVDASPPLSQGVSTAGSKFKRIGNEEVLDFSTDFAMTDFASKYNAVYGSIPDGKKIFVRVTVMMSNGQRGVSYVTAFDSDFF